MHHLANLGWLQIELHGIISVVVSRQVTRRWVDDGGDRVEQSYEADIHLRRPEDTILYKQPCQQAVCSLIDLVDRVAGRRCSSAEAEKIEGQSVDGLSSQVFFHSQRQS